MQKEQPNEFPNADSYLVSQIKDGDQNAWQQLIDRYEGRLLAFVDCRINNRSTSEDVVQDAFIGFLTSLPNYNEDRPLESYLFSICAYKLTDHLRREGRRPPLQTRKGSSEGGEDAQWIGRDRVASSIARSAEQQRTEESVIREAIAEQISRWKSKDLWKKLMVIELLFVKGKSNQSVANSLGLSEQQVANYKSDFQVRLRSIIQRMNLEESSFPELAQPHSDRS
ncbi:sigma-70 family RNA polymerase sigma factor [bacterium]|nr:sigma-70 family RNA polymerase sigma factor [bacterium]